MGNVKDSVGKVNVFVADVVGEVKKSSWPTRQELVGSTLVVVVTVLLLGAFIAASDEVLVRIIEAIIG